MKMNFIDGQEPKVRTSDWQLVGKLWPHKTKANAFSGRIGVKTRAKNGELVNIFDKIEVKADDPVMIRQANFKGEKAPSYLIYMLKDESKK